jgi:hypothetical protein
MALAAMQKGNLDGVSRDAHGRITKASVELHGVEFSRGNDYYDG